MASFSVRAKESRGIALLETALVTIIVTSICLMSFSLLLRLNLSRVINAIVSSASEEFIGYESKISNTADLVINEDSLRSAVDAVNLKLETAINSNEFLSSDYYIDIALVSLPIDNLNDSSVLYRVTRGSLGQKAINIKSLDSIIASGLSEWNTTGLPAPRFIKQEQGYYTNKLTFLVLRLGVLPSRRISSLWSSIPGVEPHLLRYSIVFPRGAVGV